VSVLLHLLHQASVNTNIIYISTGSNNDKHRVWHRRHVSPIEKPFMRRLLDELRSCQENRNLKKWFNRSQHYEYFRHPSANNS